MRTYQPLIRLARSSGLWGCSLLLLLGLAACGASGQPAAPMPAAESTMPATPAAMAAPSPSSAPAAQATQPAAAALPTAPPLAAPPAAASPTASRRPPSATAAPTKPPAPATSQDWQTYRNEQAGYSVAYPPGWRATDLSGAPGEFVTSFGPESGAGIFVAVRALDPEQREPIDLPNTRCTPVTVGGVPGMRCFDTISLTASTTVAGKGRQFIITTSGKRLDQTIYQRFLDSFAFTS